MDDHRKYPCACQSANLHQPKAEIPADAQEEVFQVHGMDCPEEIAAVERVMKPIKGVFGIRANLMASSITVYHDGSVEKALLVRVIHQSGLTIRTGGEDRKQMTLVPWLVGLSGLLIGIGLILKWLQLHSIANAAFLVAILAGGTLIFPKTLRSLRAFALDMNALMTIAVVGAVFIGQLAEGATVVFLFSLSELLETWSVSRARRAVQALMQLAPDQATVKRNGNFLELPIGEVSVGESILVKSGQRIPLDGVVRQGISTVDQAPITGESMPVAKKVGDFVYAGTINGEGSLEIQTTKGAADTTLSRIIKMVEDAQRQKAPTQRFVDVFARYYTPAVVVLALLIGILPFFILSSGAMAWVYRALVLLVIACPCALVISTPVSIVAGLTAMARRGVLIKGGAYLEALGKVRALALDKTGTITEGKPRVLDVLPFDRASTEEIVGIAATIDLHSVHPLAQAVVRFAREKNIPIGVATEYMAKTGFGAEAVISGHNYFVGNHRFVHDLGICSEKLESMLAQIEEQARSVVVVGHRPHKDCEGEVLGVLAIGDTVRANAADTLRRLHQAGIQKIVMLSGDNPRTVNAIARQIGIDQALGNLLPEDKIKEIKKLCAEFDTVAMIGDGVNDAPALAAAHVGIAMGASGTDTAIETADVALMRDDLAMVPEAIRQGAHTLRIIRFNIAFALGIKAIFLVLAVLGYTSLWLAVFADTGATLLVIANALRLLR